ncbi:hypothetical protein V6N13_122326 [Hibiscus sabdariffa]|uniref:Uncharacterized protein n=2 Tax=Hibiscus sabdariffa TaxID=183260 RepID=A0ABR2Q813_9ROSI
MPPLSITPAFVPKDYSSFTISFSETHIHHSPTFPSSSHLEPTHLQPITIKPSFTQTPHQASTKLSATPIEPSPFATSLLNPYLALESSLHLHPSSTITERPTIITMALSASELALTITEHPKLQPLVTLQFTPSPKPFHHYLFTELTHH